MTMRLISLIYLGFLTLLMTGCMIPYPNQKGGFQANVHGPNYSVGVGGAGSTGSQQGGYQQRPIQQGLCPQGGIWDGRGCVIGCPPGSVWDGRGCRIIQQGGFQQQGQKMCRNPLTPLPGGGWRDNGSFPC